MNSSFEVLVMSLSFFVAGSVIRGWVEDRRAWRRCCLPLLFNSAAQFQALAGTGNACMQNYLSALVRLFEPFDAEEFKAHILRSAAFRKALDEDTCALHEMFIPVATTCCALYGAAPTVRALQYLSRYWLRLCLLRQGRFNSLLSELR